MSNLDLHNKRGDRNRSEEDRYREKSRSKNRVDSDVESVSSYETDPEPETSFTHYLFLKTDYSLSRLSKKLVQLMANIRLDDDENGFGDETSDDVDFKGRVTKQHAKRNRSVDSSKSKDGEASVVQHRKRSLSYEDFTVENNQKCYSRLNYRPSCKKKPLTRNKSVRNKHHYNDWLDEHRNRANVNRDGSSCKKPTKIIRIDINEIDQFEDSDIRNVHYIDELFQENNINKFYSFDRSKFAAKSIYLATNAALSTSSLNSDMSDKTYQAKKKRANKKKRRTAKPKTDESHHHPKEHNRHQKQHVDDKNKKKKKPNLLRTATQNMISRARLGRNNKQISNVSIDYELDYDADLRSYNQKKNEINDNELNLFMASGKCCRRRNAIVHKIDTIYGNAELHVFMENLLRQEYIENFLL